MVSPSVGVSVFGANLDLGLPAAKHSPVSEYTVAPASQAEVFMRAAEKRHGRNRLPLRPLSIQCGFTERKHALIPHPVTSHPCAGAARTFPGLKLKVAKPRVASIAAQDYLRLAAEGKGDRGRGFQAVLEAQP